MGGTARFGIGADHSVDRRTYPTRARRALAVLATTLTLGAGLAGCAGGPTSSPENAARAFLDALKASDLEAALEVTGVEPVRVDDEEWEPLPAVEQKAASTGVTEYEILDLHEESATRATVVASLTGGDLSEIELSIERGGEDGSQWLVSWVSPGFTGYVVDVPEHWTLTLDGGTELTETEEKPRFLMLPGTTLSGQGTWTDEAGYFEPFPAGVRESSSRTGILRPDTGGDAVPTQKLVEKVENSVTELMDRQIAEVEELVATDPGRARIVSAPTYEITEVVPDGSWGVKVRTGIQWGEIEVCRPTARPWQVFAVGAPELTRITFNGYPTDDRDHLGIGREFPVSAYEEFDTEVFRFSPDGNLPLSDCGA